jgi:hypothetical protein
MRLQLQDEVWKLYNVYYKDYNSPYVILLNI